MPLLYRDLSAFLLRLYSCSIFDSCRHSTDFGETLNTIGPIFCMFILHPTLNEGDVVVAEECVYAWVA